MLLQLSLRKKIAGEKVAQSLFVFVLFAMYLHLAVVLPMDQAPDEAMRYDLAKWIYTHMALPVGNEEEIVSPVWGFSYAYNPYLPSMLAALLMRVASLFDTSELTLLVAARMVSVLASCGSVCLCFRIGPYLFQRRGSTYLLAMLVGLWPQVVFLSAYHNNDAFSLFSCFLILYFLLAGRREHWPTHRCIGLGVAISLCLLTYYYAYGWVLISVMFCIVSCVYDSEVTDKTKFIVQKSLLVAGVIFLCAGWYFIRNAVIYHGDILGMAASREFKAEYALTHEVHWPNPPRKQGAGIMTMLFGSGWILTTLKSYIGKFGYMTTELPKVIYMAYGILVLCGLLLAVYRVVTRRKKVDWLLSAALLAAMVLPVLISIYGSYTIDYQPQGRYIISSLPALACTVVFGYEQLAERCRSHRQNQWQICLTTGRGKSESQNMRVLGELDITLVAIVVVLCLGAYSYRDVMLQKLIPKDEVNVYISEDCSYLDLKFKTAVNSDGLFFVVCNEGFDVDGRWLPATKKDGTWHRIVNLSDYDRSGTYTVHIYRAFSDGTMKFAGATQAFVPNSAHKNFVLMDSAEGMIKLYPIAAYHNIQFDVWKAGAAEPDTIYGEFNEEEQCWIAAYAFEKNADYIVLAYTENEELQFIGGTK